MKISEVTVQEAARYLRLEDGEYSPAELQTIIDAAVKYIAGFTGIPASGEGETLDDHEDMTIALLVLCQDMYDNRTMYPDTRYANNANRVVESILGLHARNLL